MLYQLNRPHPHPPPVQAGLKPTAHIPLQSAEGGGDGVGASKVNNE